MELHVKYWSWEFGEIDIGEPLQCYLGVIVTQSICAAVKVSASEMFIPNFLEVECNHNLTEGGSVEMFIKCGGLYKVWVSFTVQCLQLFCWRWNGRWLQREKMSYVGNNTQFHPSIANAMWEIKSRIQSQKLKVPPYPFYQRGFGFGISYSVFFFFSPLLLTPTVPSNWIGFFPTVIDLSNFTLHMSSSTFSFSILMIILASLF